MPIQPARSLPNLRGAPKRELTRVGTPGGKPRPWTASFGPPVFLSPSPTVQPHLQRTGRSVEEAANAAARAAHTSPSVQSLRTVVAWDHAPRSLMRHAARAEPLLLAPVLAEWTAALDSEAKQFRDPLLHLELSLQLWLKTAAPPPHPLRTAAVCEVLARMPECLGPGASLLQLLRSELMRALYSNYALAEASGAVLDGVALLAMDAFHNRARYFFVCT